jgi:hypothetical protein
LNRLRLEKPTRECDHGNDMSRECLEGQTGRQGTRVVETAMKNTPSNALSRARARTMAHVPRSARGLQRRAPDDPWEHVANESGA